MPHTYPTVTTTVPELLRNRIVVRDERDEGSRSTYRLAPGYLGVNPETGEQFDAINNADEMIIIAHLAGHDGMYGAWQEIPSKRATTRDGKPRAGVRTFTIALYRAVTGEGLV